MSIYNKGMQDMVERWVVIEVEPYYVKELKSVALTDTSGSGLDKKKVVQEFLKISAVAGYDTQYNLTLPDFKGRQRRNLVLTMQATGDFTSRISQTLIKLRYLEKIGDKYQHEVEVFTDVIKSGDFAATPYSILTSAKNRPLVLAGLVFFALIVLATILWCAKLLVKKFKGSPPSGMIQYAPQ